MNKLDLGILIGAAVMASAAAGLWFSRGEAMILSPMKPSASVPTFEKFDPKKHEAERRRIAVAVPKEGDDAVTLAFHRAAKALRASPCSSRAKTAFLEAMTPYAQMTFKENLARARRGEEDPILTPMQAQAGEYFNMMPMYGYITNEEYRAVLKSVTPGMGLMIAANEQAGTIDMPDMGGSAGLARQRGEPPRPRSWEPPPGEPAYEAEQERLRRRR